MSRAWWFDFLEMSPAEADRFLEEFVASSDDVVDRFAGRLEGAFGVDRGDLDFTEESLVTIWNAVEGFVHEREEDRFGFAADEPPMWFHPEDPMSVERFPRHQLWLVDGLSRYVPRCLFALSDGIYWDRERESFSANFNQPILRGFTHARDPQVINLAGAMLGRGFHFSDRPRGASTAAEAFANGFRWLVERLPEPGAARVEVVPFRFDVSVVEVLDPGELLDDPNLPPGDLDPVEVVGWRSGRLVMVPEGVDVMCGDDVFRVVEEYLVGLPGVRRVVWVSGQELLVDAPDYSDADLAGRVAAILEDRRVATLGEDGA